MERRKKKADRKPVSKEQLQLWSDHISYIAVIWSKDNEKKTTDWQGRTAEPDT